MINMSRVVSSIVMQLGLYNITLPFKGISTDQIIMDVLKRVTIPMYSQFVPWKKSERHHLKNLRHIDFEQGIYILPPSLTTTEVLYVSSVVVPMYNTRGTFGDIAPAYGINRSVQGVITSQAYMMLAGEMRNEPTFDYLGHNKIKLYGYPLIDLEFNVACVHDVNGESIESSCLASFLSLAMYDVQIFLYNTLKHYDNIASAFGNISLKVEDHQQAMADRKAMIDEWTNVHHLDEVDWMHFI